MNTFAIVAIIIAASVAVYVNTARAGQCAQTASGAYYCSGR